MVEHLYVKFSDRSLHCMILRNCADKLKNSDEDPTPRLPSASERISLWQLEPSGTACMLILPFDLSQFLHNVDGFIVKHALQNTQNGYLQT